MPGRLVRSAADLVSRRPYLYNYESGLQSGSACGAYCGGILVIPLASTPRPRDPSVDGPKHNSVGFLGEDLADMREASAIPSERRNLPALGTKWNRHWRSRWCGVRETCCEGVHIGLHRSSTERT